MKNNYQRTRGTNRQRWIFILFFVLAFGLRIESKAQFTFGTTGLLHAPSTEMQRDKTFMFGGSYLDKHPMSGYWSWNGEYKPFTFNYYLNITLFPWLEIAYEMTLVKGVHGSNYWPPQTWGSLRIKTVPFMHGSGYGKRGGGSRGLRKSCWG